MSGEVLRVPLGRSGRPFTVAANETRHRPDLVPAKWYETVSARPRSRRCSPLCGLLLGAFLWAARTPGERRESRA